uniref:MADS-box protein 14 n=1 Tax=Cunninghamia lanceolata TaxID=28977 RepID=A0A8F2Z0K2_CUNLA|nr:MADS-box protein 14 [Cunninghamia lanceolata]
MVRAKVHLKKIQNAVNRRVTFSKRKAGLLKKAKELSILCEAEIGLIIFSPTEKLYEFASPSMNRIIGKYQKYFSSTGDNLEFSGHVEELHLDGENLQKRMTHLEKMYKHMVGENLELLSLKELQRLEKKISLGARKIHLRKEKMLLEHIRSLNMKEKSLTMENANLVNKIDGSRKACHLNIDIMESVSNNLQTDDATQQELPQTDLDLTLS